MVLAILNKKDNYGELEKEGISSPVSTEIFQIARFWTQTGQLAESIFLDPASVQELTDTRARFP